MLWRFRTNLHFAESCWIFSRACAGGGYERGLYRLLCSAGDTLTLNPGSGGPAAAGGCTPLRDGQGRGGHTAGWAQHPGVGMLWRGPGTMRNLQSALLPFNDFPP